MVAGSGAADYAFEATKKMEDFVLQSRRFLIFLFFSPLSPPPFGENQRSFSVDY